MKSQSVLHACSVLAFAVLVAGPALAASSRAHIQQPASLFTQATVDACTNNPGPFITLQGELALGGVNARLIFRNNRRGTHEHSEDVEVDVVLIPEGETIRFAKQPSRGGVGGNPWIYAEFLDGAGDPLSEEILFGRCVQGLDPSLLEFLLPTDVSVEVAGDGCSNSGGPQITLSGEIRLGGLSSRLIFRNNQKGTHEHDEYTDVSVVILGGDESITFAKQPPQGGAGGNPLIYLQFTDGQGNPYGGEIFLGRCTRL